MDKYMRESLDFTQKLKSHVQRSHVNVICRISYNVRAKIHLLCSSVRAFWLETFN
jgi:hypothetical protein